MSSLLDQLKNKTIDTDNNYTITVNNGHEEKTLDVKIIKFNTRYNNVVVEVLGDLPQGQLRNTAFPINFITDITEIGDPILKGGRRRRSCKRRRKGRKSYRRH